MPSKPCEWTTQRQAFSAFAGFTEKTQSAGHIKPLHWYVACRLVVEGGFDPDQIKPRPPFKVRPSKRYGLPVLLFDPETATGSEAVVLGGLKTKNVDVVVSKPGVGPVMAVSCKGTTRAFRNLTNRMEELIGDCTNLHISYPALVLGYLHVLRANRRPGEIIEAVDEYATDEEPVVELEDDIPVAAEDVDEETVEQQELGENDMAFAADGRISPEIHRFEIAISRLAGRRGIRNDLTRYESIALTLVEADGEQLGNLVVDHPDPQGSLGIGGFFERLYRQYDERFVYGAPSIASVTRRLEWSPESPALEEIEPDYPRRIGTPKIPPRPASD